MLLNILPGSKRMRTGMDFIIAVVEKMMAINVLGGKAAGDGGNRDLGGKAAGDNGNWDLKAAGGWMEFIIAVVDNGY